MAGLKNQYALGTSDAYSLFDLGQAYRCAFSLAREPPHDANWRCTQQHEWSPPSATDAAPLLDERQAGVVLIFCQPTETPSSQYLRQPIPDQAKPARPALHQMILRLLLAASLSLHNGHRGGEVAGYNPVQEVLRLVSVQKSANVNGRDRGIKILLHLAASRCISLHLATVAFFARWLVS